MSNNSTEGSLNGAFAPEPRVYELGYLVMPTVNEGDLGNKRDALVARITNREGIVIDEGQPVLIDLAYEMDRIIKNKRQAFAQGYFGWIKFDLNPQHLDALTKEIEADDDLVRFLLVKTVRENTLTTDQPFRIAKSLRGVTDDEDDDDSFGIAEVVVSDDEESDDLTKIEGIGPVIAETLIDAGVNTFAALAEATADEVQEIIKDVRGSHDAGTWGEQAALARDGKWDELASLQEELKGGRA